MLFLSVFNKPAPIYVVESTHRIASTSLLSAHEHAGKRESGVYAESSVDVQKH